MEIVKGLSNIFSILLSHYDLHSGIWYYKVGVGGTGSD